MEASSRTQKLLEALGHPLRRRILREMGDGAPTSPRDLNERLDEPLSNVSYHFRVLAGSGAVRLVATRPVRGSTQHFYGVNIEAEWARALLKAEEASNGGAPRGEEIA